MTEQMVVTKNPDGSHWPPYRDDWSEQLQVEYAVGCTAVDTGLTIKVTTSKHLQPATSAALYSLSIYSGRTLFGRGPMEAQELYRFLEGVATGMKAAEALPKD